MTYLPCSLITDRHPDFTNRLTVGEFLSTGMCKGLRWRVKVTVTVLANVTKVTYIVLEGYSRP